MNRTVRNYLGLLLLAATAVGCSVAPASAAPQLGVTLERDEGPGGIFSTVHHSDERVDLTVKVKNVAPKTESIAAGTTLTCEGGKWTQEESASFALSMEWLSDGAPASGPGAHTRTYEAQAADEGKVLQCVVTAHDAGGAGLAASLPIGSPSAPSYAGSEPSRPVDSLPKVSETVLSATEREYSCTPPVAGVWTGSPTWAYQWLRNGAAITGATSPTYTAHIGPGEADHLVALQCELKGENTGGTIITISNAGAFTGSFQEFVDEYGAFPPFNQTFAGAFPRIVDPNSTRGPITLEVELPAGEETFAYKAEQPPGSTWTCEKIPALGAQPAKAVCSREDRLDPGEEYAALTVIVGLGVDAPDLATARSTVFGGGAGPASDEISFPIEPAIPFGLSQFTAPLLDEEEHEYTRAGRHPLDGESELVANQKRPLQPFEPPISPYLPVEQTKQIVVDLPRGIVGNQLALPELCPGIEEMKNEDCPSGSAIGQIHYFVPTSNGTEPIFAIEPEFGAPAQFAFKDTLGHVYTFTPRLRPDDGYAVSLEVSPAPEANLLESRVKLCDFGEKEIGGAPEGCKKAGEPGANPKPLITTPTHCNVALTTRVRLNSWANPTFVEGPPFSNAPMEGCDEVPFEPQADLQPTNHQADSPTGLDVSLSMPTNGLEEPEGISQSDLREAKVTFPKGMAINASAGQGLGACSTAQIKLGSNDPVACPESSKIGSVEIETPILEDTLKGDVYIAKQGDVEGSLIGFYLVFDSPKNGILVKLPAKVTPDPQTGQLTVTVAESPEQPFSAVRMHFPGGPRATLLTPPKCGTYQITSELTPWSGGSPVTQTSSFEVNQGPNGGPCPTGALGAKLGAGTEDPTAGRTSPFVMRLSREDGSQRFSALNLTTPPGLTAYLKDIPYCPDSVLAGISADAGAGQAQIDHPSCPAASQVGTVTAGAGAGSDPLFVDTGKAYLAGPYKGAPLSLAVVAPAVAGPLDLGTVVVRNALFLNPETAQVTVKSDPIPTILHGILLDIRDIRIAVNRSHFTLNPTNCDPMSVGAEVTGESGASASLSNRFQASGCDRLSFKPKLGIRLSGGTRRGSHPRLRGVLEAGPGEANIGRAAVTIPRSEFLDQAHIRTICTRVQFAADACPMGSVYGHATATTPLLGYPVTGPVYLRSSNHKLPDLVVDLHGPDWQPIEATVVGRIDSIKGQIRTTFENAPDVPLTKFVLSMQGGKKGLLVNSRDICATTNRATVNLTGHNAAEFDTRPAVKDGKCKTERKARRKRK